jgi:quercetin dioxygenase-like cupin family protein
MDTFPVPALVHPGIAGVPESRLHGESTRDLIARSTSYANRHHIAPHWHARSQFMFAVEGTMRVRTPRRAWIVPPSRALWVPSHTAHELYMNGVVEMRSLYVNDAAAAGMPASCVVLNVTPLVRELVVRAVALPLDYDEQGDDGLLMRLLIAEIRKLPQCALDLPLPESAELLQLCEARPSRRSQWTSVTRARARSRRCSAVRSGSHPVHSSREWQDSAHRIASMLHTD